MIADGCRLVGDDERSLAGTGRRWIESEREEVWCVESADYEIHLGICIVSCLVYVWMCSVNCLYTDTLGGYIVSHTRTVADAEVGIVQVNVRYRTAHVVFNTRGYM